MWCCHCCYTTTAETGCYSYNTTVINAFGPLPQVMLANITLVCYIYYHYCWYATAAITTVGMLPSLSPLLVPCRCRCRCPCRCQCCCRCCCRCYYHRCNTATAAANITNMMVCLLLLFCDCDHQKKQWDMCCVICIMVFGVLLVVCCGDAGRFPFPFSMGILELKTPVVFRSMLVYKRRIIDIMI